MSQDGSLKKKKKPNSSTFCFVYFFKCKNGFYVNTPVKMYFTSLLKYLYYYSSLYYSFNSIYSLIKILTFWIILTLMGFSKAFYKKCTKFNISLITQDSLTNHSDDPQTS